MGGDLWSVLWGDGVVGLKEPRVEMILTYLSLRKIQVWSMCLVFPLSSNQAKYEGLILGLLWSREIESLISPPTTINK